MKGSLFSPSVQSTNTLDTLTIKQRKLTAVFLINMLQSDNGIVE